MKIFGELLKACRKDSGLTQRELGGHLKKDHSLINKLENGRGGKLLEPSQMVILEKLFLIMTVPQNLIDDLTIHWEVLRSESFASYKYPIIDIITDTLNQFEIKYPDYRSAFEKDIKKQAGMWLEFMSILEEFDSSEKEFGSAEEGFTQLINDLPNSNGFLNGLLLFQRGKQRRYLGKSIESQRDIFAAKQAIGMVGKNTTFYMRVLNEAGDTLRRMTPDLWPDAKKLYIESGNIEAITCVKIASLHLFGGNPIVALPECEKSVINAKEIGDEKLYKNSIEHLAWAHSQIGRIDSALEYQDEAINIALKLKLHAKELAKSYMYFGDFYLLIDKLSEAEDCYDKSLEFIKKTREKMVGNSEEQENLIRGDLLLGKGILYSKLTDKWVEAEKLLQEAQDLGFQFDNRILQGRAHINLGNLYLFQKDIVKAEEYLNMAINDFGYNLEQDDGDEFKFMPFYISKLALLASKVEYLKKNFDQSFSHVNYAIHISEKYGLLQNLSLTNIWKSQFLLIDKFSNIKEQTERIFSAIEYSLKICNSSFQYILNNIEENISTILKKDKKISIDFISLIISSFPHDLEVLAKKNDQEIILNNWLKNLNSRKIVAQSISEQ